MTTVSNKEATRLFFRQVYIAWIPDYLSMDPLLRNHVQKIYFYGQLPKPESADYSSWATKINLRRGLDSNDNEEVETWL